MENAAKTVVSLTDLPNYKDSFTEPLEKLGIINIEDLGQTLGDDEKTKAMIAGVKGLDPKTVEGWKKALTTPKETTENIAEETKATSVPEESEKDSEPITEEVLSSDKEPEEEPSPPVVPEEIPAPRFERNLFCTTGDLTEIHRATIDLLKMNGSKKKGLMNSLEYAATRLTGTGMEVSVNKEIDYPLLIASKGEGGIVLWGHLDTERLAGMKKKKQGNQQGDMIIGRGAANMKGAVAVMICAASRLVSWNVPFSIVLTTDALDQQKGAEVMANSPVIRRGKGIIMLTPTGLRPIIGQYGYAAILVRTHGDEAVMKMASFLKELTNLMTDTPEGLSVKTGLIRGGKRKMPYAPAKSCEVVMEIETKDTTDSALATIEGMLAGTEHDIDIPCRSEMAEFDRTSDLIASVTELANREPVFEMIHSEAPKIVPTNQKIVIWGPGDVTNSRSNQEYITLNDLEKTYEAILSLIDSSEPLENE